jgi:MOSC domain-containing protein YiiM
VEITEEKINPRIEKRQTYGTVCAVSISKKKGIPKTNVDEAVLIKDFGIVGDVHAGKWHRQISILSDESIDKMRASGLPNLRRGAFAENITTKDIDLTLLKTGSRLKIGNDVILEITQIGKECISKCAIYFRVGDCVMPREGIFAKVVEPGIIKVNDEIILMKLNDQL